VATSQVKALLDELTSVLAEMGALEEMAPEEKGMPEESVQRMEELSERAAKIKGRIEFHERMEAFGSRPQRSRQQVERLGQRRIRFFGP
jgi:hypothetical protein